MQDQENQEVSNQPEAADAAAAAAEAAAAQAAPANEPGLEEQLSATEAKLAEMHQTPPADLAQRTAANFHTLFRP